MTNQRETRIRILKSGLVLLSAVCIFSAEPLKVKASTDWLCKATNQRAWQEAEQMKNERNALNKKWLDCMNQRQRSFQTKKSCLGIRQRKQELDRRVAQLRDAAFASARSCREKAKSVRDRVLNDPLKKLPLDYGKRVAIGNAASKLKGKFSKYAKGPSGVAGLALRSKQLYDSKGDYSKQLDAISGLTNQLGRLRPGNKLSNTLRATTNEQLLRIAKNASIEFERNMWRLKEIRDEILLDVDRLETENQAREARLIKQKSERVWKDLKKSRNQAREARLQEQERARAQEIARQQARLQEQERARAQEIARQQRQPQQQQNSYLTQCQKARNAWVNGTKDRNVIGFLNKCHSAGVVRRPLFCQETAHPCNSR